MHARGELQRLHIDPYYCPALSDGYDDDEDDVNSPRSSPSSSFFPFSPSTYMSSSSSRSPLSSASEWRLCFVLCLYDFSSGDSDHLSFRKNEILEIVEKEESGWWAALRDDRIGWIPSAFVAELSIEEAENLKLTDEELRVCEYEAEKLRCSEPISSGQRFPDSSFPPNSANSQETAYREVPLIDPYSKYEYILSPSVLVIKDFPDDVAPLSSGGLSQHRDKIDQYVIESELQTPSKSSWSQSLPCPPSPATPMPYPSNSSMSTSYMNKPTPPTPFTPSATFTRSPLSRSRSDSSSSLRRNSRRRPILVNDFQSLSSLNTLLDSPDPESVTDALLDVQNELDCIQDGDPNLDMNQPRRSRKVWQLTGDEEAQAYHNTKVAQANLPWYLQPSYSSDDIKLEYNSTMPRAGTLNALVERLTGDPLKLSDEKSFRDTFLTTFCTFTNASRLLELLIARFEIEQPPSLTPKESIEWREKKLRPVQKRVLAILALWIEKHGLMLDDRDIESQLREFLNTVIEPPSVALSAKHLLQTLDKMASGNLQTPMSSLPTTSSSKRRKHRLGGKPHKNELIHIDPTDLAAQLMLYEHRLYMKIRPRECLRWTKSQKGWAVKNLTAFCETHDRLATWVKVSTLANDGLAKRAEFVDFWIKVAEKSRALNNFSSMSAIIAALSSSVISHLHLTWGHVNRKHQYDTLVRLTEPIGNFAAYRATLQAIDNVPCVPYIGILLTDLVHIQDQMKDEVSYPLTISASSSAETSALVLPDRQYNFQDEPRKLSLGSDLYMDSRYPKRFPRPFLWLPQRSMSAGSIPTFDNSSSSATNPTPSNFNVRTTQSTSDSSSCVVPRTSCLSALSHSTTQVPITLAFQRSFTEAVLTSTTTSAQETGCSLSAPLFRRVTLLDSDLAKTTTVVLRSYVKTNDKGKEIITFLIEVKVAEKEPWQIEKSCLDILALDRVIRTKCSRAMFKHMQAPLDNKLLKSDTPMRTDQRNRMLETYFQSVLGLPIKDKNEMIIFFCTGVVQAHETSTHTAVSTLCSAASSLKDCDRTRSVSLERKLDNSVNAGVQEKNYSIEQGPPLINFTKRQKLADAIHAIIRFQNPHGTHCRSSTSSSLAIDYTCTDKYSNNDDNYHQRSSGPGKNGKKKTSNPHDLEGKNGHQGNKSNSYNSKNNSNWHNGTNNGKSHTHSIIDRKNKGMANTKTNASTIGTTEDKNNNTINKSLLTVQENWPVYALVYEQIALMGSMPQYKDPEAFWERSKELQASEVEHADIRKGLEAAGF